ncbi:hypothetical protein VE03_01622 [Pseudogymnoascus sp. 23342-1-I1]|nr:hypothetical protein VE03_01622 [Pseudogymnoascus sp. 23342-1-I1]
MGIAVAIAAQKKNLIIDTDLFSDVDNFTEPVSPDKIRHGGSLLAVNINHHPFIYSTLAASAILAHYGHPKILIGIRRPLTNATFFDCWYFALGEYASKGYAEDPSDPADPVALYQKVLSEAKDGSVTIASIGFLDNLPGLLNSTADSYSPLNGR